MPRTRVTDGMAIIERREQLGIKQKDLAERIGVSASYLSRIEAGKESPGPTTDTVLALARELKVTVRAITKPLEAEPEPVAS